MRLGYVNRVGRRRRQCTTMSTARSVVTMKGRTFDLAIFVSTNPSRKFDDLRALHATRGTATERWSSPVIAGLTRA